MLVTNHVLAGVVIGRLLVRHPVGAFAAGVVSHFAMDACPHFGNPAWEADTPEFVRLAKCDGCCGLAAMAVAASVAPRRCRAAVVAGMAGAAVVDSDKPSDYFFGWNPWPEAWNRFHKRVQNERPDRFWVEVVTAVALAGVGWAALRRA